MGPMFTQTALVISNCTSNLRLDHIPGYPILHLLHMVYSFVFFLCSHYCNFCNQDDKKDQPLRTVRKPLIKGHLIMLFEAVAGQKCP